MDTEGTYQNIIKATHEESTATILSGEKPKAFLLKSGTTRKPPLTTSIQHSTGRPATAARQDNEVKWIQIGGEEVKCHCMWMTRYSSQKTLKAHHKN